MRDHDWLQNRLDELLKTLFADMRLTNLIEIRWGREAKFRFGSIRLEKPRGLKSLKLLRSLRKQVTPSKSIVTITKLFASETVPSDVVLYTVAHELTHYAHGFSSTNKRMFRHPHHGGVVNREIERRGGKHLVTAYKAWLKDYRKKILAGRQRI